MTKEEVVQKLQDKTAEDPKFSAVAHVLAFRKRDRYCMSARGLWLKMRREGFKYKEKEFLPVLEFLASLGLGTPDKDKSGNVVNLRNLRMPIPLLGLAACGGEIDLDKIERPLPVEAFNNYKPVKVVPMKKKKEVLAIKTPAAPKPSATPLQLTLTLHINDKPISIPVPSTLTPRELGALVQVMAEAEKKLQ